MYLRMYLRILGCALGLGGLCRSRRAARAAGRATQVAPMMLLGCCWDVAGMLLGCCWDAGMLGCCLDVAGMLPGCWHVAGMLLGWRWHVAGTLLGCWDVAEPPERRDGS